MSYCRFSSDDFQCDVYAYEAVEGGVQVAVAGVRPEFRDPLPPPVDYRDTDALIARDAKVMQMVKDAVSVPIQHPEAGAYKNFDTFEEASAYLRMLKREGFWVPQYAIDALDEDASDG